MILIFFVSVSWVLGLTPEEIAQFKPRSPDNIERNTGKRAVYSLTDNGDGSLTFRGNNIPPHDTWEFPNGNGNPNNLEESDFSFTLPSEPKLRDTPLTCIPRGPIGVSTSGIMIFGNFADETGCPYARDFEELDICDGHPSPMNQYHHHHYAHCIVQPVCGEPSPIVGVAIDGIPIYGPWDENGRQLTQQDLDECGGMTDSTGRYKYIMTVDAPFFMRCLKGEIRSDLGDKEGRRFICTCPYDDRMVGPRPPINGGDGQESGDNERGRDDDRMKGDDRRRPHDRMKGGDRRRPHDQMKGGDRRRPDDRMKGDDRRRPDDRMKGDDRRRPDDRMKGDDRRRPDDRMKGDDRRRPHHRMKGDDRRRPDDRMKGDDRKRPHDRMKRDDRRRPHDRMKGDDRRRPHDRMKGDDRRRPDGGKHDDNRRPDGRDDWRSSGRRPDDRRGPPYEDKYRPYDDRNYPDDDKKQSNAMPVCDFSDKSKTWANCSDKYDETYSLSREWSRSKKTIKLAACCPKGADCGFSCKTDTGIKSSCYVEEREVYVIENKEKGWCKNECTSQCESESDPSFCYEKCYDICQTGFGINHVK